MSGKRCLITGATTGIGLATAIELARLGAEVIIVGRDEPKCEQALEETARGSGSDRLVYLSADLSSQQSVRGLAEEIERRFDRLDVLVNNAGAIYLSRQETEDGLEATFALNHLAYFLLTNSVLDLLKSSAPCRVVNVSSEAHRFGKLDWDDLQSRKRYAGMAVYANSKLANVLFTVELARRLAGTGVTANTLHPGLVKSEIFRFPGSTNWFMRRLANNLGLTPERGARTSVYLASAPELERVSGRYFKSCRQTAAAPAAVDPNASARLWSVSEELVSAR